MARTVLALASAYLLGSLPFSFLVARFFGVKDVRAVGSGNVGATNVMRSAGKVAGILAFLLDAAKGALAVLLAQRLFGEASPLGPAAAAAAVAGHMYPVWLGFRGGKGVATGAGAFLPLAPLATAVWASRCCFGRLRCPPRDGAAAARHRPPGPSGDRRGPGLIIFEHRANLSAWPAREPPGGALEGRRAGAGS
jgi:hypothetical protein